MPHSMTGFGQGAAEDAERRVTVEMKSVNNRFLDVQIRMPRELSALEHPLRQLISQRLSRGKVDVQVSWSFITGTRKEIEADLGLVRSYLKALRDIAHEVSASYNFVVDPQNLACLPDIIRVKEQAFDEGTWSELLNQASSEALDKLVQMRAGEGEHLAGDIRLKTGRLRELRLEVLRRQPQVVNAYRTRLKEKLQELLDDKADEIFGESRLAAEVLVFADKAAVDEELVRLDSHLETLTALLDTEGASGKKLDFLMQEINREINTIGSKANDLEVTQAVLEMKAILEQIREQVQNIE